MIKLGESAQQSNKDMSASRHVGPLGDQPATNGKQLGEHASAMQSRIVRRREIVAGIPPSSRDIAQLEMACSACEYQELPTENAKS